MSKYTWDETETGIAYLEYACANSKPWRTFAYAKLQSSGGWIGKYHNGSRWVRTPGEYPLKEIKPLLETTVELLE